MSSEVSDQVSLLIKEKLVQEEVKKLKNKLKPFVMSEVDSYVNSKAFKKVAIFELRKYIQERVAENGVEDFVPHKEIYNAIQRVLLKIFRSFE